MTSISYATDEYLDKLRPTSLDELIGQPQLIVRLRRLIGQVRDRRQPFPPLLLVGDSQVGRGDIASAIACELAEIEGSSVHIVSATRFDDGETLEAFINGISAGDAVVVEDIERMDPPLTDALVEAAKGTSVAVQNADSAGGEVEMSPAPFSLIATARADEFDGSIESWNPLRVRDYNTEELVTIAHWCAERLDVELTDSAAFLLARHSQGYVRRLKSMFIDVLLGSVEMLSQKGSWIIEERMVEEQLPEEVL